VYQSPAAGQRWRAALALGSSRSWSDVLEAMTGERRVTGKPMRKYFAPLETWLKNEAAQLPIGWQ
jgi:peptidyl-dipeptidase A